MFGGTYLSSIANAIVKQAEIEREHGEMHGSFSIFASKGLNRKLMVNQFVIGNCLIMLMQDEQSRN